MTQNPYYSVEGHSNNPPRLLYFAIPGVNVILLGPILLP
jgi:hypothetical protein